MPRRGRRHLIEARLRADRAKRLRAADLTEIRTWESKRYLTVFIDCCSRRCVRWKMAEHIAWITEIRPVKRLVLAGAS